MVVRVADPPSVGDYTVVIPGAVGDASVPAGDSYATLHVGADGLATMNGTLADGTIFAQSAYVTAEATGRCMCRCIRPRA